MEYSTNVRFLCVSQLDPTEAPPGTLRWAFGVMAHLPLGMNLPLARCVLVALVSDMWPSPFAQVTELLDISMELGCFLAGALISSQGHMVTEEVVSYIEPIRDFLVIIFFASIGNLSCSHQDIHAVFVRQIHVTSVTCLHISIYAVRTVP